MNKLTVFVVFFIAAWFVPAWPLLLGVGIIWLIAALMAGKGNNPPDGYRGGEEPESPPPSDFTRGWRPFCRTSRKDSKPFFRRTKR